MLTGDTFAGQLLQKFNWDIDVVDAVNLNIIDVQRERAVGSV